MKRCGKCKQERPKSRFNKHCRAPDGLQWWCKDCQTVATNEYTERVKKDPKRVQKWRSWQRSAQRKWQRNNPHKDKARVMVNYYIGKGEIERGPCEVCGTTKNVHGHHDDYSRPLDVRWLCSVHHAEHHRLERAALAVELEGGDERRERHE